MKKIRVTLTAIALIVLGGAAVHAPDSFTFEPDSRIWIEGTSTVHDWTCNVERFTGSLEATAAGTTLNALSGTTVSVPVNRIECNNGTMNGKLRTALGESPIRFTLVSATLGARQADGWFSIRANGRLTIAGASQSVSMTVRGKALSADRFRFTGQLPLRMTDYGVDPPTALLGTLRTGDQVTVHFDATARR